MSRAFICLLAGLALMGLNTTTCSNPPSTTSTGTTVTSALLGASTPVSIPPSSLGVSLVPEVTVRGGEPGDVSRLRRALTRFEDAGLALPDVDVTIHEDDSQCRGHKGLFRASSIPWTISICSATDSVFEHEFAHAWERGHLTDTVRQAFMELRGHEVWSGADTPWNERGQEGVAFVIQQGLSDVPLAPALSDEALSRVAAFELLTGQPAPRLVRWMESREVACSDRPTPLSRQVPDQTGTTCA
ncbi:MAG TPA: hypothetical protein VMS74_02925 [Acidimicrobiia bacterium]|nr:hypothetical protein [Acidimicrobiia bacterium]